MRYPIVIHKEDDTDYGVIVPDLPGCHSAGSSLDEAIENAREAIECHLEGLLLDGERIPRPGTIEEHKDKTEFKNGVWSVVDVDLARLSGKTKRVNITLPERVLAMIDEAALASGESRSGFLAKAALEAMLRERTRHQ